MSQKKVIVKVMTVKNSVQQVFDFFSDPKHMELGGAVKLVNDNEDGWWIFDHNIAGRSKMKHISVPQYGILDHTFIGGGLEWNVYVRIIPNEQGSTTTWTFLKPDGIDENLFEKQLGNFDNEIENWKKALETH